MSTLLKGYIRSGCGRPSGCFSFNLISSFLNVSEVYNKATDKEKINSVLYLLILLLQ